MRILLKFPTRSRPEKAYSTLSKYVTLAGDCSKLGVLVSCDVDDTSMTNPVVQSKFQQLGTKVEWFKMCYSPNKTKIEACNADVQNADYPWDIIVLISDDMIPQERGYDMKIRLHMRTKFPDTNGILWFNDGHQRDRLNTFSILGRKMYESFGYIYHPSYKSLFCDQEFTDLCKKRLREKCAYIPYCIVRHDHPWFSTTPVDELYQKNQVYWNEDMYTYISRKTYDYDWSVLIPTIPGREKSLAHLRESIREKVARLYPELRYEIRVELDNRVMSIGKKRELLLQSAQGKYMSFIDDDDDITDAYIQDLKQCILGNYHVMRLYGSMKEHIFMHSLDIKPTDTMATQSIFVRPPNHLNPMLTDVAVWVHFQDAVHGEDLDWAIRMSEFGLLSQEYKSPPEHIHYIYNLGERVLAPDILARQQRITCKEMLQQVFVVKPQEPKKLRPRLGAHGFVST